MSVLIHGFAEIYKQLQGNVQCVQSKCRPLLLLLKREQVSRRKCEGSLA
jgi:hypothetical protein